MPKVASEGHATLRRIVGPESGETPVVPLWLFAVAEAVGEGVGEGVGEAVGDPEGEG